MEKLNREREETNDVASQICEGRILQQKKCWKDMQDAIMRGYYVFGISNFGLIVVR